MSKRIEIRVSDYYFGDLYVENVPEHEYDEPYLAIVFEAYEGGGCRIILRSAQELEALGKLLLHAAGTIDPERIERETE